MDRNKEYIRTLLFEKIGGTISEEDDRLLEEAIRKDSDVAAMWQEVQELFNSSFLGSVDANAGWVVVKDNIRHDNKRRFGIAPMGALLAAAVLLGCIIMGVLYFSGSEESPQVVAQHEKTLTLHLADGSVIDLANANGRINGKDIELSAGDKQLSYKASADSVVQWASLFVPNRLDYRLALPDGSTVWLNASSSLRFPYGFHGNTREVYLEGEAFFEVAKNAAKPFIVHAGNTSVQVLGTAFNINTYEKDKVITSLVHGSVKTFAQQDTVILKPGYQSVFAGDGFGTSTFDSTNVLSWMQGIVYFNNEKLSAITSIIRRWYDVELQIDNPALMHENFSGAINKHKPLKVFLTNISISSGIQSYTDGNGKVHLK
jgi:transmembrane sensor